MHFLLAALLSFGILTLWVPAYWPIATFQVGLFALAGVSIWRAQSFFPRLSYPAVPLAFAALWGIFQLAVKTTAYAFETERATVRWATFLAVFIVAITVFRDDAKNRWFRSFVLWFGFAVSAIATLQTFTSGGKVLWLFPTPYTDFVMGPFVYHSDYAAFIEIVLPLAVYEALAGKRDALLYSGIAGTMYASVLASASRAGTVLTTAEIVLVTVLMWGRGRATGRTIGGSLLKIAALFATFTAVVGYDVVWKRFGTPDPMAWRREFAISSIHMIQAHPWFGVGLGVWPTVYPRYAIIDVGGLFVNQAHNDWLQWTAEGGIIFGVLMATLFLWAIRPAFRSIWGIGVLSVFLHAIVDYPFARPALGSWIVVMIALLATAKHLERNADKVTNPLSESGRERQLSRTTAYVPPCFKAMRQINI